MDSNIEYETTTLYDRQIRLWGMEAQQKMSSLHVLFIGCTCANVEAAKNLVLSGVNVSLTTGDISEKYKILTRSHMFLNSLVTYEEKLQLPETDVDTITYLTVNALKNLNPLTRISFLSGEEWKKMVAEYPKNTQSLKEYDILVIDRMCVSNTNEDLLNEACRDSKKGLFFCHSLGLHGAIFKDFGSYFSEINVSYPSFQQVMRVPYATLPSGFSSFTKQLPHAKLVAYLAFLKKTSDSITSILENIGHAKKSISEAEQWFCEIRKYEHVPNAVQACILGGIIAEEIQMSMSKKGRELHNLFLFDGNVHEGIIFNVQINQDKLSSSNPVDFQHSNIVL
ncbi:uncharacterized protein LOC128883502 [Hylaeus volcanicus]|uniref:uncharacterized protein LOC128883502 n=1 Tax=Hylaeus volcanicus TaxID=313075 RepID=UPI0023B7F169|nr:uncharacterized protein LOC128883502 [Hylaeus volcanicus]XP_053991900.1 uncharacterized protein LOC128883502 [Hylaeus volcanicus]